MMEEEDSFCSGPEILLDNDNFSLNDSLTGTDSMASGFIPHRDVEESQRDKDIAGEGAVEVLRSRRMVIAMLLLTAALVITTTYIFLSREETDEFEKSFTQSAKTIKDAARFYGRNGLNALQTLGDTIASDARVRGEEMALNETWPFVTTRDFEIKSAHARLDATMEFVMFAPIVTEENSMRWEEYSVDHQDWLVECTEQGLQTRKWFDNEIYYEMGSQDPHEDQAVGHGGMDNGELDQGDVNHSTMDHSLNLGSDRRFLQVLESMGSMDGMDGMDVMNGMDTPSMPPSHPPTGDADMSAMDSSMDMGDTITGINMNGMSTSTSSMETDGTTMPGMAASNQTAEMTTTGMHSMNHSVDISMDGTMDHRIPSKLYQSQFGTSQESHNRYYVPVWQMSPPPKNPSLVNYDLNSDPVFKGMVNQIMISGGQASLSNFVDVSGFYEGLFTESEHWHLHDQFRGNGAEEREHTAYSHPHTVIASPVRSTINADAEVVGILAAVLPWDLFLSRLLPQGINGVYVVLENSCGQVVSYVINGPEAVYLGGGDLHETRYDYLKETYRVSDALLPSSNLKVDSNQCEYTMFIYPSTHFRESYNSTRPESFTSILTAVFVSTGIVFCIYVQYVQRRQNKIVATALRTNAIVSSLFPSNVRDRVMQEAEEQAERYMGNTTMFASANKRLKNFLEDGPGDSGKQDGIFLTKPIADLFPETTLMFADMVGFTAWSSVREPCQVFTLLETVYHAFDEIAKRRGVFKVETVGDCYMAVAGLPEPRKDHAVVMAHFAHDCNVELIHLVKQLEVTLGPDTGDLAMRFGLHSGPVTAGVLRGQRARFQLFGDTVNTAARVETTGEKGRIHVSQETADLLVAAGKSKWVKKREEKVVAKGKGELQTYWLDTRGGMTRTQSSNTLNPGSDHETQHGRRPESHISFPSGDQELENTDYPKQGSLDDKTSRLIDWNVENLLRTLRQVVARRQALCEKSKTTSHCLNVTPGATVLDEVKETITLPRFDANAAKQGSHPEDILLGSVVENELHDYVTTVAMLYRENPFHNFEHASHVAMSVVKLLSRIIAPSNIKVEVDITNDSGTGALAFASTLHDHTYGITSDPLTQFACIFSALIHDVDHVGVPNTQLIKENTTIAALYKGKSVAEQNSVDIAWTLLMDERYENLRRTIYNSETEFKHFRQVVVNSVMATDIMDKDLKGIRNGLWEKAFNEAPDDSNLEEAVNRKATIVIEHMIQASDVAHTMQHWHIYRKWNARLFSELYKAYVEGRAEKDPSEFWYEGELGFFDFYIIPLAKKLKDCGVFGVSSYEYLDYAERNRAEWEAKGRDVVESMVESVRRSKQAPMVTALGSRTLGEEGPKIPKRSRQPRRMSAIR